MSRVSRLGGVSEKRDEKGKRKRKKMKKGRNENKKKNPSFFSKTW